MSLIAPIRTTESGSGTFLGLASDGNEYWIKAPNNPQGVRTLAAEVVVHGIGNLLGAPVCETALIDIPATMNWLFTPQHRLNGGIGHASLNLRNALVSEEWTTYSALDHNRERQAILLGLWDLCMGGDPQWLHDVAAEYSIWSFDHGFWLGGDGDCSAHSLQQLGSTPWQYDLELGIASARALRIASVAVGSIDRMALHAVTDQVPVEWGIPRSELAALADILFVRAEGVAQRLAEAADVSSYG